MEKFKMLHPLTKIVYYSVLLIGVMSMNSLIIQIITLLFLFLLNDQADGGRQLRSSWRGMLFLFIFVVILTPLFNNRGLDVLFYFYGWPITLESILLGLKIGLSMVNLLLVFTHFNLNVNPRELVYLIHPLSSRWAILIVVAYRFTPLLKDKINEMRKIQILRGREVSTESLKAKVSHGSKLLGMILTQSLEYSIQSADSMTSRGYALGKRTQFKIYRMKKDDHRVLITSAMIFVVSSYIKLSEKSYDLTHILFYLVIFLWLIIITFPLLMKGWNDFQWKYYEQKTSASNIQTLPHRR